MKKNELENCQGHGGIIIVAKTKEGENFSRCWSFKSDEAKANVETFFFDEEEEEFLEELCFDYYDKLKVDIAEYEEEIMENAVISEAIKMAKSYAIKIKNDKDKEALDLFISALEMAEKNNTFAAFAW